MFNKICSDIGAALMVHHSNPESDREAFESETKRLRDKLGETENGKVKAQTSGFLGSKIPSKYKNLVNPGEWKVSEMDEWIEDGENRLIHQDQVMELIPPSLNAN